MLNVGNDVYTRTLQKDIRCPLEHGLEIFW